MFLTTPLGAKLEQQIFDEGEGGGRGTTANVNRNWDGVWDAAARVDDQGWTAEIEIPFSTVRFVPRDAQVWGVNFQRHVRRKNETALWAPIPKAYTLTRVSMAGELHGLSDISRGLDLRLKPFMVAGVRDVQSSRTLRDTDPIRDIGLDARYGVTAGLNMDVTINTDFAQVEVDEQQVNLTRFGLFYPEKRDFFLENSNFFTMGTGSSFTSAPVQTDLFFSRRIGLSDTGTPIPILGGVRLAGKSGKNNIGMLDIQTDDAFGRPGDNFFVGRYSRDVFRRSRVGAIFINKDTVGGSSHFNRTMGVDANLAPSANLQINSYLAKTRDAGQERRRHGVLWTHRVPRSEMEPVAELPRCAGQLQCRGGLRPAHRHPHHQGILQPDAAAEGRQSQVVRADVRPHVHDGSKQPAGLPQSPPDAGHHATR